MRPLVATIVFFLGMVFVQAQKGFVPTPNPVSQESKRVAPTPPKSGKSFRRTSPSGGQFVWIRQGKFTMGSPETEGPFRVYDETQHEVTLTPFWMLDHEVTQAEYEAVMQSNPSQFKGPNRPVENVTWFNAVEFCDRLTERDRKSGWLLPTQKYRLPTEAQWEYAARAGATGIRYGEPGAILKLGARETYPVRSKSPNKWGLYDMLGNVEEWTADWMGDYPKGPVTNPTGPGSGVMRVIRGGSWFLGDGARSAGRFALSPYDSAPGKLGFRVIIQ